MEKYLKSVHSINFCSKERTCIASFEKIYEFSEEVEILFEFIFQFNKFSKENIHKMHLSLISFKNSKNNFNV